MALEAKAFSLTELLVTTSIGFVLAALLLPVLSRAKERAYRVCCLNCLRQQGIALKNYDDDTGYYTPYGPYVTAFGDHSRSNFWDVKLQPYLGQNIAVSHCPSVRFQVAVIKFRTNSFLVDDQINWIPAGGTFPSPNLSYGYNATGTRSPDTIGKDAGFGLDTSKECSVLYPSQMISVTDYNAYADDDGDGDLHPYAVYALTLWPRHTGGANALFCDGHVIYSKTNALHDNQVSWNRDHLFHE